MSTGADVLVQCLIREGVEVVFGLPGTTVIDVLDGIAQQSELRFVSVRHEQAAGFAADGYARATRDVGVCLVSRGPGAANVAIAVQNAYDESIPVVVLVGQVPKGIAGRRAFEEAEVLEVFGSMTKWSVQVNEAQRIPELVQRACRTATSGRPGPVLVSLPLDVLQMPCEAATQPRWRTLPPAPHPDAIGAATKLLHQARRPLLILGGGVTRVTDTDAFTHLAEVAGAAVTTTWLRKDVFPNGHPHFIGSLGYGSFPLTDDAVRQADLVLALGCRFSEFTSKRWTLLGEGTRLIHVDIDTIELGRVYQPDVAIHADAALTARALVAAMEDKEARPTVESHPADLRRRFLEQALAIPEPDTPPNTVGSADLVRALQAVVSRDDVLFVQDVHTFGPWLARHLQVNRSGSYFGAAGGAMGWGFPAAMGVALARPDQRVVAVSGDGSFWMVAQELETCVREGIPVVNVVVNNFAYGNTRDRQRFSHSERYLGVFLDNPDMAAFARLMGAHGERVADPRDLEQALHTAIASELPSLVEIVQDQWEGLPPGLTPLAAH